MTSDREEEVAVLYALYCKGGTNGKASKERAVNFVLENALLRPREGDDDIVETGETRIFNRLCYARQDLKDRGQLAPSDPGLWKIGPTGVERLLRLAVNVFNGNLCEYNFDRFTVGFLDRLRALGARQAADANGAARKGAC